MIGELAARLVPVVVANLSTRYPYHDAHLFAVGDETHDPFGMHPAFGNSFDWHSSVHSHWTALQLIDYFAGRADGVPVELAQLQDLCVRNLATVNVAQEEAYLIAHPSFERPYGWAWALLLAAAAARSSVPALREGAQALRRLAETTAGLAVRWLDVLPLPIRQGVHSNTAFALGVMDDASRALGMVKLQHAIAARARRWFFEDREWPERWERSGHDFLSPGLTEADLMRRVLERDAFAAWWASFLPNLPSDASILAPADVPRIADGHVVHLHGLNLSRAGQLARIGAALNDETLRAVARRLYDASAGRAVEGHYTETHWLPTFAWSAATSLGRGA